MNKSISKPIVTHEKFRACTLSAAALLLVPADQAPDAIRVIGSASATDTLAIHDRQEPLWLSAAEKSVTSAYEQAGLGPEDIDIFELHDAFSIMAALSLEACGFAEKVLWLLVRRSDVTHCLSMHCLMSPMISFPLSFWSRFASVWPDRSTLLGPAARLSRVT